MGSRGGGSSGLEKRHEAQDRGGGSCKGRQGATWHVRMKEEVGELWSFSKSITDSWRPQ